MKITDIKKYQNEDGSVNLDLLNEEIVKFGSSQFQKGGEKTQKTIEELNSKIKVFEDKTNNLSSEKSEADKKIDLILKDLEETKKNNLISDFRKSAKDKLTDDQMELILSTADINKLGEIDLSKFEKIEIGDKGKKIPSANSEEEKAQKLLEEELLKEMAEL